MEDDIDLAAFEGTTGDLSDLTQDPERLEVLSVAEEFAQASLLVRSCSFAETHFGLRVSECNAPGAPSRWGPVHTGAHSPGSYHYRGRAADLGGTEQAMQRFCAWALKTHTGDIAELIHNPGASVKDGRRVPASFWGGVVWAAHRNHVHLAI